MKPHQLLALPAVLSLYRAYKAAVIPVGLQVSHRRQNVLPDVAAEEVEVTSRTISDTTIAKAKYSTSMEFFHHVTTIDTSADQRLHSLHDETSNVLHAGELKTIQAEQSGTTKTAPHRPVRVVYGIMSHDMNESGKYSRQNIRNTFLSFYSSQHHLNLNNVSDAKDQEHWICSLNDLLQGKLREPDKCRFAYAFVVGANPNGPTILFNYNESYPLALSSGPNGARQEDDVVYLNIKENMNDGKTPTWFRYATSVLEERGWQDDWDYIFKADSDNLLYPPKFFRTLEMVSPMERPVRNIYGGWPRNVERCQWATDPDCQLPLETGNIYFSGGCYFLSTNLATFISDPTTVEDHQKLISMFPHEDVVTGLAVRMYEEEKIQRVDESALEPIDQFRVHWLKRERPFILIWKAFLRASAQTTDFVLSDLDECIFFGCYAT
ncbi:hypothetical protein ACA910_001825 [Epithemia clementina (nom. ined.)]